MSLTQEYKLQHNRKSFGAGLGSVGRGFTLIELLVVIAIIALLLAILMPSLRKAKEAAKSIVCRNHLKTLGMSNQIYSSDNDLWFVSVIDTTMQSSGQATWNSNDSFRKIIGFANKDTGSKYDMPAEYLCPSDTQSKDRYWDNVSTPYKNFVSFGYNMTDWSTGSKNPINLSGNIPSSTWACRLKSTKITSSSEKIMFIDAGDIWAIKYGADFKLYWDKYRQDIVEYRKPPNNMWHPTYYRHNEGANIAFFDGHAERLKKEDVYRYDSSGNVNEGANNSIWFCDPRNKAP